MVTELARSIDGVPGVGPDRSVFSGALPFAEGVVRTKSKLSVSRARESGSDQRLGKGTFAVTLDSVPSVRCMGNEGGIRSLISYTGSTLA